MNGGHGSFYATDVKAISFCGDIIGYQLTGSSFKLPFEVPPIAGPHDFNNCKVCQNNLATFEARLNERFNGYEGRKPFPYCCEFHTNLVKLKEFRREAFMNAPVMVAHKIIYTNQQIVNSHDSEEWFVKITHYIKWMVESFGEVPVECGEPLFFRYYIDSVIDLLVKFSDIPEAKKKVIQEFLKAFISRDKKKQTDLNILLSTYEKWFKLFPFEISYLSHLKEGYRTEIPILDGKPEVNIYSGNRTAKMHDKESLVESLIRMTDSLLTKINLFSLYEQGLINDADKVKLELIISSRKLKLSSGYINRSVDEERRYRRILKAWFKDEKDFINDITPFLKKSDEKVLKERENKLKVNQIALIYAYEGNQITRDAAGSIAASYGYAAKNSGEGLFQDYIAYCSPANRKEKPTPCTPKRLKNKIVLFESILPHLSAKATLRANDEIKILKTHYENDYQ